MSVAHNTLLISRIYFRFSVLKNIPSRMLRNTDKHTNPMTVPRMPRKLINPKFSKNKDFLRLYPAENIIGGNMIEKNMSLLNCIS